MNSVNDVPLSGTGYPIRKSPVQRLLATSPKLIAGCYVLHRLLMSRHPPYALILGSLFTPTLRPGLDKFSKKSSKIKKTAIIAFIFTPHHEKSSRFNPCP